MRAHLPAGLIAVALAAGTAVLLISLPDVRWEPIGSESDVIAVLAATLALPTVWLLLRSDRDLLTPEFGTVALLSVIATVGLYLLLVSIYSVGWSITEIVRLLG